MPPDPRIGQLNNGQFYVFSEGYDKPPFTGSLSDVSAKLGIGQQRRAIAQPGTSQASESVYWDVHLQFQYPAWDEVDGLWYKVIAASKPKANTLARRIARNDGHLFSRAGRVTFTAHPEKQ